MVFLILSSGRVLGLIMNIGQCALQMLHTCDHEHELDYHMKPFMGLDASLL